MIYRTKERMRNEEDFVMTRGPMYSENFRIHEVEPGRTERTSVKILF